MSEFMNVFTTHAGLVGIFADIAGIIGFSAALVALAGDRMRMDAAKLM